MNERSLILSQSKNFQQRTVNMPKSLIVRVVGFFNEKFDAIALLFARWTNF
jgi:hypothetical protein